MIPERHLSKEPSHSKLAHLQLSTSAKPTATEILTDIATYAGLRHFFVHYSPRATLPEYQQARGCIRIALATVTVTCLTNRQNGIPRPLQEL